MAGVFRNFYYLARCLNPLFGFSSFLPIEIIDAQPCRRLIQYSPKVLRSIRNSSNCSQIEEFVYCKIMDCGILKPFRGCRGGKAVKELKDGCSLNIRAQIQNRKISISNPSRSKVTSRNLISPVRHATILQCQNCTKFSPSIRFCTMNTQSLNNKAAIFTDFICDYKPDIVAVTETWFHENESAARVLCTPIGYNLLDHPRSSRQGGGTGLVFRDFLSVCQHAAGEFQFSFLNIQNGK